MLRFACRLLESDRGPSRRRVGSDVHRLTNLVTPLSFLPMAPKRRVRETVSLYEAKTQISRLDEVGREPHWVARPTSNQTVRIGYLLSYYRDSGNNSFACSLPGAPSSCNGHNGDSEAIFLDAVYASTNQHWLSEGKHANCASRLHCDNGGFGGSDTCGQVNTAALWPVPSSTSGAAHTIPDCRTVCQAPIRATNTTGLGAPSAIGRQRTSGGGFPTPLVVQPRISTAGF